jgi:single-strand DNA-binding protein
MNMKGGGIESSINGRGTEVVSSEFNLSPFHLNRERQIKMYQQLTIVGNLGNDPELRTIDENKKVCNFSVATNYQRTDQAGESIEETTWFRVSVWNRQAEACAQYLSKGRIVLVSGRLKPDKETGAPKIWMDPDGLPRTSYELVASTVKFVGGRMAEVDDRDYVDEEAFEEIEAEIPS